MTDGKSNEINRREFIKRSAAVVVGGVVASVPEGVVNAVTNLVEGSETEENKLYTIDTIVNPDGSTHYVLRGTHGGFIHQVSGDEVEGDVFPGFKRAGVACEVVPGEARELQEYPEFGWSFLAEKGEPPIKDKKVFIPAVSGGSK